LLAFIDTMIAEGFLPLQHKAMIIAESNPRRLLDAFRSFAPVTTSKWM
jgi:predicted Rossmann-fold nucleotide-binding protein